MPSIGQAIIQGLATGFQGNVLATDLAKSNLELAAGQRKAKQEEYQASADKVWSKAIMDVLAGSQPLAGMPQTPAPGQASVPLAQPGAQPQTQGPEGAAARPVAPGTPGPGAQAPPPQVQTAGGATPSQATLATLGQTAVPQTQPPPIADPMNAANILAKIKADNPNLDAGVLSSVVNDHLMPYLTTQQQNSYKQFQQQLEIAKLSATEQDKAQMLYFRYQQLQEQMDNAGANRELRTALAQQQDDIKQQMVQMRQPLVDAQIAALEARKQKDLAASGAITRLPPAMQAKLKALTSRQGWLNTQIDNAHTNFDDARAATLEAQIKPIQDEIDAILAQAEQLDAQGAPQQPAPSKGSGDTSRPDPKPVPTDEPVAGVTADQWSKMKPAQRVIVRDVSEAVARISADTSLTSEQKKSQIAAVQADGQKKYDALAGS